MTFDYFLVIGSEWTERTAIEREVWKLAFQPDCEAIYRVSEDREEMTITGRNCVEDCAHAWFEANWGVDDPIPALFLEFVEDEAAQRENAQDEVGSW